MAQLPNSDWLVQSSGTKVFIVHRYTEEELLVVDATNIDAMAKAQLTIHNMVELDEENKAFAHFWFGYFWACLGSGEPEPEPELTEDEARAAFEDQGYTG